MVQALVEVTSLAEKGGTDRAAFLEFLGGTVLASDWVRKRTGTWFSGTGRQRSPPNCCARTSTWGWTQPGRWRYRCRWPNVHQLIQSAIGLGLGDEDFLSLYDSRPASPG